MGAAEDLAFTGVGAGALDEPVAVADGLGGEQDPLGVPAVDHVAEALALRADERVGGDLHAVVAHLVGGVVEHRADGLDLEGLGLVGAHLAQVDEEQADPVGAARRVVRAGAGPRPAA
jgi:hypothetical protein